MLPYNYRSRSSLLAVSSRTILWTAKTLFVSPRHQYKVHVPCCSHRQDSEQLAPPSGPATGSHLHTTHGASTISYLSHAPQPPVCTIHVGTHPVRSATSGKRSAGTALAGTHNPVDTDPRAWTVPFPKPRALVLPLVHFGQSKPEGHNGLDTADSDLMHHQFRLSLLQWNPGPARRHPTNIIAAACGKFHAVVPQEASDHVPHISDQFMAFTGNTDLALLLKKDTFETDPLVLTFKVRLYEQKYLGYDFDHCSTPPETSISHWFTDCYFLLGTYPQCCG